MYAALIFCHISIKIFSNTFSFSMFKVLPLLLHFLEVRKILIRPGTFSKQTTLPLHGSHYLETLTLVSVVLSDYQVNWCSLCGLFHYWDILLLFLPNELGTGGGVFIIWTGAVFWRERGNKYIVQISKFHNREMVSGFNEIKKQK